MSAPNKLIAGNWKMNGLQASLAEVAGIAKGAQELPSSVKLAVCPPFTLIDRVAQALDGTSVGLGGQDCHTAQSGAHTGETSAEMLKDLGAEYVIVGHSERRTDHGESNEVVAAKAEAAIRAGLTPIICVGETLAERESEQTLDVVNTQLAGSVPQSLENKGFVVAYEPVWAIGTGLTPTTDQVKEVHQAMRKHLEERFGEQGASTHLLYGGSVKPGNAAELMAVANVDGALVGGASLKAVDFLGIAQASA